MDDETVKRLQAEAARKLQEDFAKAAAAAKKDPVKSERRAFGCELARVRFKQKISQNELAQQAGMYQADISRIENGKANPSLNTILKITKALEADLMLE